MQYSGDVLLSLLMLTLETCMVLLTNVTPINSIKKEKLRHRSVTDNNSRARIWTLVNFLWIVYTYPLHCCTLKLVIIIIIIIIIIILPMGILRLRGISHLPRSIPVLSHSHIASTFSCLPPYNIWYDPCVLSWKGGNFCSKYNISILKSFWKQNCLLFTFNLALSSNWENTH